jgi:hypothetical protein
LQHNISQNVNCFIADYADSAEEARILERCSIRAVSATSAKSAMKQLLLLKKRLR